jgi:hypothetical protein
MIFILNSNQLIIDKSQLNLNIFRRKNVINLFGWLFINIINVFENCSSEAF